MYYPSGAFQWGASNDEENNAYHKAQEPGWENVILVTINYRTGIFGFLASPGLSARSGDNSSGLFGIHDQTMALKWIQKNIEAFGGDKDRVMIYGESAGATSMSLHLVMEESAGLFHAVAIDSGAFNQWTYRSWGEAQDDYNNISKAIGCDESANDTACFLSKSMWALLNVSDAYYGNATGMSLPHPEAINNTQWGPVVEGNLLPQPPIQMLREGKVLGGAKVPVLLGSNADEGTTFLTDQVSDEPTFKAWCNTKFGNTTGEQVSAKYIAMQPPIDPAFPDKSHDYWNDAAQDVIGDFVMRCPTRDAATALSEQGHDVFLYNFVHQPGMSVNWPTGTEGLGAFHGAEVPFVFHDDFELMGGEVNLSSTMSTYWTNMASSGDPNTWSGPTAADLAAGDERGWRQLQPGPGPPPPNRTKRSKAETHWWDYPGIDCDTGVFEKGHCTSIPHCKAACMEDDYCGGFMMTKLKKASGSDKAKEKFQLKYADCGTNIDGGGEENSVLFFLREFAQPPPPPPNFELPNNCSLFQQRPRCYDESVAYKSLPINISLEENRWHKGMDVNTTCLNKCCEACAADLPKCKGWFVPPPKDQNRTNPFPVGETVCHLMAEEHKPLNNSFCIGAMAPRWIPPPQCHARFTPFSPGERVNWTASSAPAPPPSPGHHHWHNGPGTQALLPDHRSI